MLCFGSHIARMLCRTAWDGDARAIWAYLWATIITPFVQVGRWMRREGAIANCTVRREETKLGRAFL